MKSLLRFSAILLVIVLFVPGCFKDKSGSTVCLIKSATQGKRKISLTYSLEGILLSASDYSDSTNNLTLNFCGISYNIYHQVSSVVEQLETGARDSITFDYSVSQRIIQKKYFDNGTSMLLEYTRSYVLDNTGFISSDTVYANPVKGASKTSFSKYTYDGEYNLTNFQNFTPDGNLIFSYGFTYADSLIKSNSYNVSRFTFLDHYGNEYQFVFPILYKLPLTITYKVGSQTTTGSFTYDLDANGNAVADHYTVAGCDTCAVTTKYTYVCK